MNIAVFGGSFDPPHIGHVQIVKKALNSLPIEKLFIVPTYLNPFKSSFKACENTRFSWLKKLFEDEKKVEILDYEIKQKRAVLAIETVKYLLKNYDINKIYLIIGADNYLHIEKWNSYDKLKDLVEFVIAPRNGISLPEYLQKLDINVNISSSFLRKNLKKEFLPPVLADDIIKYYGE